MQTVGDLLKRIESSGFFSGASLKEARKTSDRKSVGFSMSFNLKL